MSGQFAYAPLGQNNWKRTHKHATLKTADWPRKVPSFELWCQMTCYDPAVEDGGETFQAVMIWVLTNGPNNGPVDIVEDLTHKDSKAGPADPEQYYIPAKSFTSKVSGGAPAFSASGNRRGWSHDPNHAFDRLDDFQSGNGYQGHGKIAWLRNGGFNFEAEGLAEDQTGGQSTNVRQFRQTETAMGTVACFGLQLAAFYGLYYYPKCTNAAYNWSVKDGRFNVRMRLPNPNYSLENNGRMYVTERMHNGSDFKVSLPTLMDKPSPWSVIAHQFKNGKIKSILQPWAGPVYSTWVRQGSDKKEDTFYWEKGGTHWNKMQDKWVKYFKGDDDYSDRMFKRDNFEVTQIGGRAFGWSMPVAHHLYPHADVKIDTTPQPQIAKPTQPLYQEWPAWRIQWQNFNRLKREVPLAGDLEMPPTDLREYALTGSSERFDSIKAFYGSDSTPIVTQPPTDVQTAQVPAAEIPMAQNKVGDTVEVDINQAGEDDDDQSALIARQTSAVTAQPEGEMTAASGLAFALGDEANKQDEKELEVEQIDAITSSNKEVNLGTEPLEPGSARRGGDTQGNHHFFSSAYAPWSVLDVYEKPFHMFVTKDRMTPKEVEDYEYKYGSAANLYLRSTFPAKLTEVQTDIGTVKMLNGHRIFDYTLDGRQVRVKDGFQNANLTDLSVFHKNMRRILGIYYDNSGPLGLTHRIEKDTKRKGMLKGIFVHSKSTAKCSDPTYDKGDRALPPVFKTPPPTTFAATVQVPVEDLDVAALKLELSAAGIKFANREKKAALVAKLKTKKQTALAGGNPFVTAEGYIHRGKTQLPSRYVNAKVDEFRSEMTVLEWLQTPWHYEYLPFQEMSSTFKDSETYCAGCTRCSRPFFEYQHLYSDYFMATKRTSHWQHAYWRAGPTKDHNYSVAPLPFHHVGSDLDAPTNYTKPETFSFWSEDEVRSSKTIDSAQVTLQEGDDEPVTAKGFHMWPTHAFLLGFIDGVNGLQQDPKKEKYKQVGTTYKFDISGGCKGVLCMEWLARAKLEHLVEEVALSRPFTFRQYLNHVYDPIYAKKYGYDALFQGVVRSRRPKICYGMREYRLMRSIKFGNVCLDCAATLDLAPGLYKRTGRVTSALNLAASGKYRPGQVQVDTWWLGLKDAKLDDGSTFDPWFLYMQTIGRIPIPNGFDANGKRKYTYKEGGHRKALVEALKEDGVVLDQKTRDEITNALAKDDQYKIALGDDWENILQKHLDAVEQYTSERSCIFLEYKTNKQATKVAKPPEVYTQKVWDMLPNLWKDKEANVIAETSKLVKEFVEWLDSTYQNPDHRDFKLTAAQVQNCNRGLRDALTDTHRSVCHLHAYKRERNPVFDPDMVRREYRNASIRGYDNCLLVFQPVTAGYRARAKTDVNFRPEYVTQEGDEVVRAYCWDVKKGAEKVGDYSHDWAGDDYVRYTPAGEKVGALENWVFKEDGKSYSGRAIMQERRMTQSRVFITYSLHRAVKSELEARGILEKMAEAVRTLFGEDSNLCKIVLFGVKLQSNKGQDTVSSTSYATIEKPKKAEKLFYGQTVKNIARNSYIYDTYQTHVESVTVDAGIEIGPTFHHPHFHALVTINHWSYVQIDTFRMKAILEQMFKGTHLKYKEDFMLKDGRGFPFYHDNENPYVDIRLYPTDNWADVISAYVRKGTEKESIMALRARTGEKINS